MWNAALVSPGRAEIGADLSGRGGWDENYGVGGAPGGLDIPLSVPENATVVFDYDSDTHLVSVTIS